MRSYGQYCGLAKALDVIGDRWSLLIVRELLLRERCRYTDLREGLPGIATNLLAERLRELERLGVIEREDAPPPVATTLFRLGGRGRLSRCLARRARWPRGRGGHGACLAPGAGDTGIGPARSSSWMIPLRSCTRPIWVDARR